MEEVYDPVGWKVYTLGRMKGADLAFLTMSSDGFMLDDEVGLRFLERARELDVKLVCVHKGLSMMVDNGSPRDIGPAARPFLTWILSSITPLTSFPRFLM